MSVIPRRISKRSPAFDRITNRPAIAWGPTVLKKGSDPLETVLKHLKGKRPERVRPLFQQAAIPSSLTRIDYDETPWMAIANCH